MILVVGATGMFGSRVANGLTALGRPVRALVRDPDKARTVLDGAELAVGDLDRPETLPAALAGVDKVFLVSPMDGHIAEREIAVITAAKQAGVGQIVKLYGAVKHERDALDDQHGASLAALRESGLRWVLVSPNSVMETSVYGQLPAIRQTGEMWACAGDGRVAMVAADDVGRAAVAVLASEDEQPDGTNYVITGPASLTMTDLAAAMTEVLGRPVAYHDLPEDDFRDLLVQTGMTAEEAEIGAVAHFRAWRQGGADLVTGTYRELTGLEPTDIRTWLTDHRAAFD